MKIVNISLPEGPRQIIHYHLFDDRREPIKASPVVLTIRKFWGGEKKIIASPIGRLDYFTDRMRFADEVGRECSDSTNERINNYLFGLQVKGML